MLPEVEGNLWSISMCIFTFAILRCHMSSEYSETQYGQWDHQSTSEVVRNGVQQRHVRNESGLSMSRCFPVKFPRRWTVMDTCSLYYH